MFNQGKKIKVHFIGIGGIGMSSIAEVLINLGLTVTGSDLLESENTKKLKLLGAKISLKHDSSNIQDPGVVVYSSAVRQNNPELVEARSKKIPILKRAEMIAELMRLKSGIAIAGTHGKTTATSFLVTIMTECNLDPTYMIGGIVKNLKGHAGVGPGKYLVTEADESDGTFLLLNPVYSAITNIDEDHMEYYKTRVVLLESFSKFANNIPFYGCSALNAHDKELMQIRDKMKKPSITFAVENSEGVTANIMAKNIVNNIDRASFDLFYNDRQVETMEISIPGHHNILNALSAITLSHLIGISFSDIAKSIKKFKGIGRRFQVIYKKKNLHVVDDYAHHPTEIISTLKTIRSCKKDIQIIAVFEPHRFTRTRDCWNEFQKSFFHADKLYVCPIYPASEDEIEGINSNKLVSEINQKHSNFAISINKISDIEKLIEKNYEKDTVIVSLGAGVIGKEILEITERLKKRDESIK